MTDGLNWTHVNRAKAVKALLLAGVSAFVERHGVVAEDELVAQTGNVPRLEHDAVEGGDVDRLILESRLGRKVLEGRVGNAVREELHLAINVCLELVVGLRYQYVQKVHGTVYTP